MITSRQNQRVKDIRRLRRSKGDRALLEGPHLVAEALAAGLRLEEILAVSGNEGSPSRPGCGEMTGECARLGGHGDWKAQEAAGRSTQSARVIWMHATGGESKARRAGGLSHPS